ncbi:hypothetical protein DYB28_011335 [Aphanomyces astaci]|uniref:Uncharacterized protein n=1 Tax=Aphanomyces astaci TaxID=112090 RepID=A0A9X8H3D9_APHAT|nr:hypothetical protein DYB28_011335 [Aphanomyces astaci]
MDLALLREVLRVEPYDGEYGTLTLRWKTVAANISACFEMDIPHHSARDHYESMLETFMSSDRAQRLWGTGNEEAILEKTVPAIQAKKPRHIQLLQDLVDRREEKDEAKKAKKEKDQKRRDSLESTGSQLCLEAEQRVAKRQRTAGTAQKKDEMERLEFNKEEQKIRLVQMSESAKRNDQLERLLI